MSSQSGSTLTDVPGVNSAVQRLQDLGHRMTSEEFGFQSGDVSNIDHIIEAIKDLENECRKLHEKMETETIKASVLRHTLTFLPGQITDTLQDAIQAARESNKEELIRLQTNLDNINSNIEFLQQKHTELEKENSVLHPERDQVRQQHEEIIAQLNQRMAEKASKQIMLNETRDKLRETNQKIVDLEEGILQLKEDLIQERADARMEKKKLKKAVYDTTMKTREQKEINVVKKKELDGLHDRVMISESKLGTVRKSIRKYETSRSRLEAEERSLTSQYNKEIKQNQDLKEQSLELTITLGEQEREFEDRRAELQAQVDKLEKETSEANEKNKELDGTKKNLEKSLTDKAIVEKEDKSKVKELNEKLQGLKQELAWKVEDAAKLRQENIDMETRITELGETHDAIISTFQKQIDEMRTSLSKERKDRMGLQEEKDGVQKNIDDFKVKTQKFMNDMNKRIVEGKRAHDDLTREGTKLQKSLRDDDEQLRHLQQQLQSTQADFDTYSQQSAIEVENIKREIQEMKDKHVQTAHDLEAKTPGYEELIEVFNEDEISYEKMKKDMVSVKNKKLSLEDTVKRANKDLDKMIGPQKHLQKQMADKRVASLSQLKHQAEETSEIEKSIHKISSKLKTALQENDRFLSENCRLQTEIEEMTEEQQQAVVDCDQLEQILEEKKEELGEDWNEDNRLQQIFSDRDQILVDDLGSLLEKTGRREDVISGITNKLNAELKVLAQFLDNVAKRRPKEIRTPTATRQSKPIAQPELGKGHAKAMPPSSSAKSHVSFSSSHHRAAIDRVADANVDEKGEDPSPLATPKPPEQPRTTAFVRENSRLARLAEASRTKNRVQSPTQPDKGGK